MTKRGETPPPKDIKTEPVVEPDFADLAEAQTQDLSEPANPEAGIEPEVSTVAGETEVSARGIADLRAQFARDDAAQLESVRRTLGLSKGETIPEAPHPFSGPVGELPAPSIAEERRKLKEISEELE